MSKKPQHDPLVAAEQSLDVGPVEMSRLMGTPYSTYKKWRNENRKMPSVGWKCLELLLIVRPVRVRNNANNRRLT